MHCHLLQEGLMLALYLFWDRRTGRVLHSPGNDHLGNLDDLHRGSPRWDRDGSRHWCRDALPSCDHRSGSYSLQGKNQPEKSSHEPSCQLQAFCSFPRNWEWRKTLTAVISFPLITFCKAFLWLQAQIPPQEKFCRKLEVYLFRLSPLEERDQRAVMFVSVPSIRLWIKLSVRGCSSFDSHLHWNPSCGKWGTVGIPGKLTLSAADSYRTYLNVNKFTVFAVESPLL